MGMASAQESGKTTGLTVGGYGEVVMSRNFYSDNVYRYSNPTKYKDDPSHGRFDVPHAVIYLGYDFGHGWTMQTEIEFEHTGTGGAVEKEFTEAGEWEQETEKGGEEYNLIYPEVTIPEEAFNTSPTPYQTGAVAIRLESTIGIIGSGLLDAIPQDSIRDQYRK